MRLPKAHVDIRLGLTRPSGTFTRIAPTIDDDIAENHECTAFNCSQGVGHRETLYCWRVDKRMLGVLGRAEVLSRHLTVYI